MLWSLAQGSWDESLFSLQKLANKTWYHRTSHLSLIRQLHKNYNTHLNFDYGTSRDIYEVQNNGVNEIHIYYAALLKSPCHKLPNVQVKIFSLGNWWVVIHRHISYTDTDPLTVLLSCDKTQMGTSNQTSNLCFKCLPKEIIRCKNVQSYIKIFRPSVFFS